MPTRPDKHLPVVLITTLALTAAIYGRHLNHAFQYDDLAKIVENPRLRDLAAPVDALIGGTGYRELATRLLPNLSLSLNYRAGGLDPFGYHLGNLLLHLANCLLVWALARSLARRTGRRQEPFATLAAGLFALHPLNSEAVAYANARANLMVTTFYLGTCLLLFATLDALPRRNSGLQAGSRVRASVLAASTAITAACALMSKEMAITLVAMIPVLLAWLAPHDAHVRQRLAALRLLYVALIGLAAAALTAGGALDAIEHVVAVAGPTHTGGTVSYLGWTWLGQAQVLLHYLALALVPWPSLLNACRDNRHLYQSVLSEGAWIDGAGSKLVVPLASLGVLSLLVLMVLRERRRRPLLSLCSAWVFVAHAPHTLLPRSEVMVEYRTYLPMVGACMFLSYALVAAAGMATPHTWSPRRVKQVATTAGACLLLSLGALTYSRLAAWTTVEGFWQDVLDKDPDSPRAHNGLGDVARRVGDLERAARHYKAAAKSNPQYATAHSNLGAVFATTGRPELAQKALELALQLDPGAAYAHSNLANVLIELGQPVSAITHYRRAIELEPRFVEAHMNLARAHLLAGEPSQAIARYQKGLAIDDQFAPGHRALGQALLQMGRLDAAQAPLERAVQLAPDDPDSRFHLARARAYVGRHHAARAELEQALQLSPEHRAARALLSRLPRERP
ncbi:MAG: tetratricopeptide repeat protein [Myxococcales bacterium]|nr:tetratricopeptide repeat protein [Myxococcales bacterium]